MSNHQAMDNPRQDLRDMLRALRRFAESHSPADDHDREEYWRGLQAIEVAENILVPPRNLADDYPEAKPFVGGLDELDANYERLERRYDPEAGA